MLDAAARRFLERQRVGHLATADAAARPHVVPVCYAVADASLYITIDAKPKSGRPLRRLANIAANSAVAVVVDRYDEDWRRLGWVLLRGAAEVLHDGPEHGRAQAGLRARYPQYRAMDIAGLPVIAVRIDKVTYWGEMEESG